MRIDCRPCSFAPRNRNNSLQGCQLMLGMVMTIHYARGLTIRALGTGVHIKMLHTTRSKHTRRSTELTYSSQVDMAAADVVTILCDQCRACCPAFSLHSGFEQRRPRQACSSAAPVRAIRWFPQHKAIKCNVVLLSSLQLWAPIPVKGPEGVVEYCERTAQHHQWRTSRSAWPGRSSDSQWHSQTKLRLDQQLFEVVARLSTVLSANWSSILLQPHMSTSPWTDPAL